MTIKMVPTIIQFLLCLQQTLKVPWLGLIKSNTELLIENKDHAMLFRNFFPNKDNHTKELPEEIIVLIFSYLHEVDIYHASLSCKLFNGLSQNENLKQYFQARHTNYITIPTHKKIAFEDTKNLSIYRGIALYGSLVVTDTDNNALGIYGHTESIADAMRLSDTQVLSVSYDKTYKIWDTNILQCQKTVQLTNGTGLLNQQNDDVTNIIKVNDGRIIMKLDSNQLYELSYPTSHGKKLY